MGKFFGTKHRAEVSRALGKRGERMAVDYLRSHHFTILETNRRIGRSEIDIVAKCEDLLVFVEVKLRSNDGFGTPESFVTPAQVVRYHAAATAYLEETGWKGAIRFDIIALEKKAQKIELHHFEDAF